MTDWIDEACGDVNVLEDWGQRATSSKAAKQFLIAMNRDGLPQPSVVADGSGISVQFWQAETTSTVTVAFDGEGRIQARSRFGASKAEPLSSDPHTVRLFITENLARLQR